MKIHTDPNCQCHLCHPENYSFGESKPRYLYCMSCGKQVSTGFIPVPTETPDRGIIVRAYIECPECIETRYDRPSLHEIRSAVVPEKDKSS